MPCLTDPRAVGACDITAGGSSPHLLPTPALSNKLPVHGGGSAGKLGGGPGGGGITGDTPATGELAVVMVVEAMVA